MNEPLFTWDALIVGGGPAGLSAAIYLGRSRRRTLLVHSAHSMAKWEKDIQNYLGFPSGIDGEDLLTRGLTQARRYNVAIIEDTIQDLRPNGSHFDLQGSAQSYRAKRVLLATGLTHLPPELDGVRECLGHSLFFCKDCDAYRVQGKRIVIMGHNPEAAEYALAMLLFTSQVMICTNGRAPTWSADHERWLEKAGIPVRAPRITALTHDQGHIRALTFESGDDLSLDAAFTTRGDVVHNALAACAGAELDDDGQVIVNSCMRTSIPGLYAAGCLTPANCQMIIAAGQGATAGQAMNRDLFEESLHTDRLPRFGEQAGSASAGFSIKD
jgi:thioredoxin reductase (NADPH)